MIWVVIIALALAALAAIGRGAGASRSGWQVIAAALLLGLAGYAWQGRPGLAGASHNAGGVVLGNAAASIEERRLFTTTTPQPALDQFWLIVADAMTRHGDYADAAGLLRGATDRNPRNATAWLALGNALVGHAQGTLSPAAQLAYGRAAAADPAAPGPPFFLALAMAGSGQLMQAREIWLALRARAPANAPWRSDLDHRLVQADSAIRMIRAEGGMP